MTHMLLKVPASPEQHPLIPHVSFGALAHATSEDPGTCRAASSLRNHSASAWIKRHTLKYGGVPSIGQLSRVLPGKGKNQMPPQGEVFSQKDIKAAAAAAAAQNDKLGQGTDLHFWSCVLCVPILF